MGKVTKLVLLNYPKKQPAQKTTSVVMIGNSFLPLITKATRNIAAYYRKVGLAGNILSLILKYLINKYRPNESIKNH